MCLAKRVETHLSLVKVNFHSLISLTWCVFIKQLYDYFVIAKKNEKWKSKENNSLITTRA